MTTGCELLTHPLVAGDDNLVALLSNHRLDVTGVRACD